MNERSLKRKQKIQFNHTLLQSTSNPKNKKEEHTTEARLFAKRSPFP